MSIGGILALVVLVIAIGALVFSAATPSWLPWVLFVLMSVAVLLVPWRIPWGPPR